MGLSITNNISSRVAQQYLNKSSNVQADTMVLSNANATSQLVLALIKNA